MKHVLGIAAVWVLGGMTACAESNPLLGTWTLSAGDKGCNTTMVFTTKLQSFTWRGSTSSAPVSGFVVTKDKVIVGGSPGVIETFSYVFIDKNTISQPNMSGGCVWKRK